VHLRHVAAERVTPLVRPAAVGAVVDVLAGEVHRLQVILHLPYTVNILHKEGYNAPRVPVLTPEPNVPDRYKFSTDPGPAFIRKIPQGTLLQKPQDRLIRITVGNPIGTVYY
jgi:hypothetical protein